MRKTTLTIAMLALAAATQTNAATYDTQWQNSAPPSKASYTITLSGECTGKITQEIKDVFIAYGYEVDDVTKAFVRDSSWQSVYIQSPLAFGVDGYFYTETGGANYVTKDKFTEKVAKGKRTISFSVSGHPEVALWPISDEPDFNSAVKCKGDKSLTQVLGGDYLYFNYGDPSFKAKTTVTLVSALSNPTEADYTVMQSISGIAAQGGICTGKGAVGSDEYNVSCSQPPPIKVNVQVKAQGPASPSM